MTSSLDLPVDSPRESTPAEAPEARAGWRETVRAIVDRPAHAALLVGVVAAIVRLALFLTSQRPIFTTDSGVYLVLAHDVNIAPDRAVGVSVFYRVVLGVWHDVRAVVVVQALLGIAAAVLTSMAARLAGLRPTAATACGIVMALSPSMLLFERVVMPEVLTVFLTVLSVTLVLWALERHGYARAIVAGVVAGLGATVRTNGAILAAGLVIVVLIARVPTGLRVRLGLSVCVLFGALLPIAGYSSLTYVDSRADYGTGVFGLTVTDGFALFARVAPLTDCSEPAKPPALRAEVCAAGTAYLNSGDAIVWAPGPVNTAFGSPDLVAKNEELQALARENILAHPLRFLRLGWSSAWAQLTKQDYRYAARADEYAYAGGVVEQYFGRDARVAGDPRFADVVQDSYSAWTRIRALLWLGLAGAIVMSLRRRAEHHAITGLALGMFVLPVGLTALAAAPLPRYLIPYEFVAVIATAWLLDDVACRVRRRAARRHPAPLAPDAERTGLAEPLVPVG